MHTQTAESLAKKRTVNEFSFGRISLDRICVITQILRNQPKVDKSVLDIKLLCYKRLLNKPYENEITLTG